MPLLSRLRSLLGIGAAAPAGAPAGGALAGPPELTSGSEEGLADLLLFVDHHELQPMGSQVLRATAVHRGRRVGLEVVLGPDWREGTFADRASFTGLVTWRSVGAESDELVRVLDELYGTKRSPRAMARHTDFSCATLGGDPRALRSGPVHAKLFHEGDPDERGEGGEERAEEYAELYVNVDLAARRLEIREKDPDYRAAIVRALTATT